MILLRKKATSDFFLNRKRNFSLPVNHTHKMHLTVGNKIGKQYKLETKVEISRIERSASAVASMLQFDGVLVCCVGLLATNTTDDIEWIVCVSTVILTGQ